MFNFIRKLFKTEENYNEHATGWLGDIPDPEKAYKAEELYSSFDAVVWTEKKPEEWKRFLPIRNQNGTSACVGYAVATMLGAENYLEESKFINLSPRSIYARGYQPEGGMFYEKALSIGSENGATLESLLPSELKKEEDIRKLDDEKESDRIIGKIYKGGKFIYLPKDIDSVASFIQKGKAIAIGTRFNSGGFNNGEIVLAENGTYGHAITGIDFTLWKGEKAIVFQNSWGDKWGFGGLGIITETQFKSGGYVLSAYYEELKNEIKTGIKPRLKLYSTMKVGDSNGEVIKLQIMLQYFGFFPSDIKCTGYYGGITRQAVKDYQLKNGLAVSGVADAAFINNINKSFI